MSLTGAGSKASVTSSSVANPVGLCKIKVEYSSYDPCPIHQGAGPYPEIMLADGTLTTGVPQCDCPKTLVKKGSHEYYRFPGLESVISGSGKVNIFTKQWAQFAQVYLMGNLSTAVSASSVLNTANSGQTIAASNATSTFQVVAGTTGTAAAFTDVKLGAQSASSSGFVTAAQTALSSNAYTITGTITNGSGSTISYNEVGIYATANSQIYCWCHDAPLSGGPYSVSNSGTLAITYTHTWT